MLKVKVVSIGTLKVFAQYKPNLGNKISVNGKVSKVFLFFKKCLEHKKERFEQENAKATVKIN